MTYRELASEYRYLALAGRTPEHRASIRRCACELEGLGGATVPSRELACFEALRRAVCRR
jgi:hypothetical protein